jgi:hypothetical protein
LHSDDYHGDPEHDPHLYHASAGLEVDDDGLPLEMLDDEKDYKDIDENADNFEDLEHEHHDGGEHDKNPEHHKDDHKEDHGGYDKYEKHSKWH